MKKSTSIQHRDKTETENAANLNNGRLKGDSNSLPKYDQKMEKRKIAPVALNRSMTQKETPPTKERPHSGPREAESPSKDINNIGKSFNIKVFVRLRPLLKSELGKECVVKLDEKEKMVVIDDGSYTLQSNFDEVFNQNVTQAQVFQPFGRVIPNIFVGYNVTFFAYGQTGSGKTYSMFGADWENLLMNQNASILSHKNPNLVQQTTCFNDINQDINYAGIIPRTIHEVFQYISNNFSANQFNIYCSFMQIYTEKIFDLLQEDAQTKALNIHESKFEGIFVEGLAEYAVTSFNDCLMLMRRGEKNRIIRETSFNTKSSRSHTIFQMIIESSKADKNGKLQKAKVNLCDLAGSEKINKNEQITVDHMKELKNINLSLTTLGKVINILSGGSKLPAPFRESKLTRLLQDSLGGNTQTYILANISPTYDYIEETGNTLKFAERAKHIVIRVKPNQISATDDAMIQKLQKEINYLKDLLSMKRKGMGMADVHAKLIYLQEENERLRQMHVSVPEVERLLEENRKMKTELQKIKVSDNEFLDSSFKLDLDVSKHDLPTPSNNSVSHHDQQSFRHSGISNEYALNQTSTTSNSHPASSSGYKSLKSEFTNPYTKNRFLINAGNIIGGDIPQGQNIFQNSQVSEVVVRRKAKNNNYETSKGYVEMSNDEYNKQEQRKKEKMRALERLKDLERIQKYNEEKLQKELKKYEPGIPSPKNGPISSINSKNFSSEEARKQVMVEKQKKKMEEYNLKIKRLERAFF